MANPELSDRMKHAIHFFELAESYLTDEQREILQQISSKYDERKVINDPNWGGIHFKSFREAIEMTPGGKETMKQYAWIQQGLMLSPEFIGDHPPVDEDRGEESI